ncbi:hypothetical protein [uncultured Cohaesibacter sp.]|uniref:hypothetical protein n=1 Tax=uncultured Cohaesibacter sp. TaxID=1002546 RepID=UPI0029C77082|nr:hypothetical protein [uncultured Cohaesibacter sp.]
MRHRVGIAKPYRPPISVSALRDPVSGQVHFRLVGPFSLTDPRNSTVTPSELIELNEAINKALEDMAGAA